MSSRMALEAIKPDWVLRSMLIAALVFLLLCALLLVFLVPILGWLVVVAVIAVDVYGYMIGRRRSEQQDALLWTLTVAAEREMPLDSALEAIADQHSGSYRVRLRTLAGLLKAGAPLPEALGLVPGLLPNDARVLFGLGWDSHRLAGILREEVNSRSARRSLRSAAAGRVAYLMMVLLVIQVIVAFLMYFIIPKFEAIFKDFGVPLPQLTVIVIMMTHSVIGWGAPIMAFFVLGEAAVLLMVPFTLAGWWNVNTPLIDRLLLRKHTAMILRGLAWAVEAGRTLRWGVATLARRTPSNLVRSRLEQVYRDVDAGGDCWEALEVQGLIRSVDRALLEAAARVGNLTWALRETAEGAERRLDYRLRAWSQFLAVPVLLSMGAVVLLLAMAYFLPLIVLIERLTG